MVMQEESSGPSQFRLDCCVDVVMQEESSGLTQPRVVSKQKPQSASAIEQSN